jgi:hypothetical protein
VAAWAHFAAALEMLVAIMQMVLNEDLLLVLLIANQLF